MIKTAWTDNNNYEGKALRRVFTKLLKCFEKEINNNNDENNIKLEQLQKISHTITLIAKTKADLAFKETRIEERIKLLEKMIPVDTNGKTKVAGAKKYANDLPSYFRN